MLGAFVIAWQLSRHEVPMRRVHAKLPAPGTAISAEAPSDAGCGIDEPSDAGDRPVAGDLVPDFRTV